MSDDKGPRFALVSRSSGKQSGRKNQEATAIMMEAVSLTDKGVGGGIVSLLLPRTTKQESECDDLALRYEVRRVKLRAKGLRQEVREAAQDEMLISRLAVMYEFVAERARKKHKRFPIVRNFSKWVRSQLKDNTSEAYKFVNHEYPNLLSDLQTMKNGWWERQIANRRKTKTVS